MSNNQTDIAQIKKYLNGELDARAMHELERRAQQDPFLADALEGYEATGTNPDRAMPDLQQRLQQRTAPKERTLFPQRMVAAAAMVLICGAGLWWYLRQQPQPEKVLVAPVVVQHQPEALAKQHANAPADSMLGSSPAVAQQSLPAQHQIVKSHKPIVKPKPVQPGIEKAIDSQVAGVALAEAKPAKDTLDARVAQTNVTHKMTVLGRGQNIPTIKPGHQQLTGQQLLSKAEGAEVESDADRHMVSGQLLNGQDGQPLMGALVKIKNNLAETLTDRKGNFHIAARNKDVLVLSSAGYLSQEVKPTDGDSIHVALQPASTSLSEMIVMGYNAEKNQKNSTKAEPLMGWQAYKGYIGNAKSPDGKKGSVKLSVVVNPNGSLSDFAVLDGLSEAANRAAISLIKTGPAWHGNMDGKPETIKLKVVFQ